LRFFYVFFIFWDVGRGKFLPILKLLGITLSFIKAPNRKVIVFPYLDNKKVDFPKSTILPVEIHKDKVGLLFSARSAG